VGEYNPQYPPGFLEARKKYPSDADEPEADSVTGILCRLDDWRCSERCSEKGFPKVPLMAEQTEEFKARILKAVLDADLAYLKNLIKAADPHERPQSQIHGIVAAILAFNELFIHKNLESKDDWPTKQEVRRRAEEILREAGRVVPGERQWPRIFRNAGLWALESVTYGRARKRKKN
jgi:hypothetical protein